MFGLIRDGINVCLSMGYKPLLGMSLPGMFTLAELMGVYFNNTRKQQVDYTYNKFQGFEGIDDH